MIGKTFNYLTIVKSLGIINGRTHYECMCVCGNIVNVRIDNLKNNNTKSCGCLTAMNPGRPRLYDTSNKKLNKITSKSKEYVAWYDMIRRCYNSTRIGYNRYGGRGITVCERWLESFENFLEDMGICPPNKSLDRINNNGNYEPSNCRWATCYEQTNNRG